MGAFPGAVSSKEFVDDGTTYTVPFLMHTSESLWLGVVGELPMDFTLRVGDSTYVGSESMVPETAIAGAYWWPSAPPGWFGDEPVEVSLTVHPAVPMGDRQKAPPTVHFRRVPPEHGGEDFSFRIY